MLLTKRTLCNIKKTKVLKEQEAKGLLSNLIGIKIPSDLTISNAIL